MIIFKATHRYTAFIILFSLFWLMLQFFIIIIFPSKGVRQYFLPLRIWIYNDFLKFYSPGKVFIFFYFFLLFLLSICLVAVLSHLETPGNLLIPIELLRLYIGWDSLGVSSTERSRADPQTNCQNLYIFPVGFMNYPQRASYKPLLLEGVKAMDERGYKPGC